MYWAAFAMPKNMAHSVVFNDIDISKGNMANDKAYKMTQTPIHITPVRNDSD